MERPGTAAGASEMAGTPETLHEALGCPPLGALLPVAGSPAWSAARCCLQAVLCRRGVSRRIRSPGVLWRLLWGGELPRGATWGSLTGGKVLDDLLATLRGADSAESWRVAAWNLRWAVSPHTQQAAAKRELVRRWLEAGRAVLLQETHWSREDEAVWAPLFPTARLHATPAVPGPRGGAQGGVAVLLPHGADVLRTAEAVPGSAVLVELRKDGQLARLVSLYLPPGGKTPCWMPWKRRSPLMGPPDPRG